jgi:hypothetical protein
MISIILTLLYKFTGKYKILKYEFELTYSNVCDYYLFFFRVIEYKEEIQSFERLLSIIINFLIEIEEINKEEIIKKYFFLSIFIFHHFKSENVKCYFIRSMLQIADITDLLNEVKFIPPKFFVNKLQ